ncbi:MAG: xanthine dehydrogenase accessory protein XdhC [Phycisphaerales bacterium]|nr:xanthine dehydrogenase accessory protein XdhC [Phycisphaerales bacterium]
MSAHRDIWTAALELSRAGTPFVMITVIDAKGSTPRNPGARMIWRPGAGFLGTVGGGQFEHLVLDAAEAHFARRSTGTEHYVLGADADQCCGGTIDVFFEYVGARQTVVLFGAGHVAHEIARLLDPAPVRLVIVDDRPEWNTAERFPMARRVLDWDAGVRACREDGGETLACVMTCSHDTDFELLRALLPDPPSFVGLIGSRSKRVCLFGRLVASGIDEERVQSVRCPIGVGDTGKEPPLVAISIAAELLVEVRRRATVQG